MAVLDHLPNEILIHVLRELRALDLQTFLVCQAVKRRFRVLVQDLLLTGPPGPETEDGWTGAAAAPSRVHPLLAARFQCLFDTAAAFTIDDRQSSLAARSMYLSLQGDYLLPFRSLPCFRAQSDSQRAAATRPEASWRRLSVTEGRTPITHLDIVKDYAFEGYTTGGSVQYSQLELPWLPTSPASTPYLTMGMLYDLLLSEHGTFRGATGAWELLLDRRLRSFDILDDYQCFIHDDPQLVEVGGPARGCAILHVSGGDGCENAPQGEGAWSLKPIGEVPRFLPWQGPRQDIGRGFYLID